MQCCHCEAQEPCAGKIGIFRHLDRESQQKISDLAIHRQVKKGEILCAPGQSQGVYLISRGRVKIYELSPSGKEKLLRVLKEGDFLGEEALFGREETYTFAEALTDLQVCHIPREDFLKLLMSYPSISIKLLEELNHRLVGLSHRSLSEHPGSVLSRLAGYLLELAAAQDSLDLTLPMQMKELAGFLSTTPETLSRKMSALEKQGIVSKKGSRLTILNREALAQISG